MSARPLYTDKKTILILKKLSTYDFNSNYLTATQLSYSQFILTPISLPIPILKPTIRPSPLPLPVHFPFPSTSSRGGRPNENVYIRTDFHLMFQQLIRFFLVTSRNQIINNLTRTFIPTKR